MGGKLRGAGGKRKFEFLGKSAEWGAGRISRGGAEAAEVMIVAESVSRLRQEATAGQGGRVGEDSILGKMPWR